MKKISSRLVIAMGTLVIFILAGCGSGGGAAKYTVTYDGNGSTSGSVPVDSNKYEQGQTVTVLGNPGNLMKPGYEFYGWSTQADGGGTIYAEEQTFTMGSANVKLYAFWGGQNCEWVESCSYETKCITQDGQDNCTTEYVCHTNFVCY